MEAEVVTLIGKGMYGFRKITKVPMHHIGMYKNQVATTDQYIPNREVV